jgi:hypothetical protein
MTRGSPAEKPAAAVASASKGWLDGALIVGMKLVALPWSEPVKGGVVGAEPTLTGLVFVDPQQALVPILRLIIAIGVPVWAAACYVGSVRQLCDAINNLMSYCRNTGDMTL